MSQYNLKEILNANKPLINKAKEYMFTIEDFEHDYNHVNDVVNFVTRIIDNIEGNFDIEVCIISAYWHDVGRTVRASGHEMISAEMLKSEMLKLGYKEDVIKKCYNAILYHKWNMNPESIEGKIVKDADKLAWLGSGRWNSCINSNQRLDDIIKLLPKLRNEILYFDISKKIYDEEIINILTLIYNKRFNI